MSMNIAPVWSTRTQTSCPAWAYDTWNVTVWILIVPFFVTARTRSPRTICRVRRSLRTGPAGEGSSMSSTAMVEVIVGRGMEPGRSRPRPGGE